MKLVLKAEILGRGDKDEVNCHRRFRYFVVSGLNLPDDRTDLFGEAMRMKNSLAHMVEYRGFLTSERVVSWELLADNNLGFVQPGEEIVYCVSAFDEGWIGSSALTSYRRYQLLPGGERKIIKSPEMAH